MMTRKRWDDFCRALALTADHRDEISREVAGEQMGSDELLAWHECNAIRPEQTLSDVLEHLGEREARDIVTCLLTSSDLMKPATILRDALRQLAISDAVDEAKRRLDDGPYCWRVPDHFDAVARDRRDLAREHNALVKS